MCDMKILLSKLLLSYVRGYDVHVVITRLDTTYYSHHCIRVNHTSLPIPFLCSVINTIIEATVLVLFFFAFEAAVELQQFNKPIFAVQCSQYVVCINDVQTS
jgi:hypothetical protein